jgi:predicted nucleotidyltransferase component of viral defense system
MKSLPPEIVNLIRDARSGGLTGFSVASLEKDVHISSVLKLIAKLKQEHYSLVFCGGTSLIKAHRIIERMSEDVDFKIILENGLSTSARRRLLSQIRDEFLTLIDNSDYSRNDYHAENNNSHFQIDIEYESAFERTVALRPTIKVEFTETTTALPTRVRTATTLIGDVAAQYLNPVELECLSLEETMAEKVVSFLRRQLPYFRKSPGQYEGQLVRHVYDVHMLSQSEIDFAATRQATKYAYSQDAERYAKTNTNFASEPKQELLRSLGSLNREEIASNYAIFVADLLNGTEPECEEALDSFIYVAESLLI